MKLRVLQAYTCREVSYPAGATIEVTPADAAYLMADAPGSFELFTPEAKEMAEPPQDKAVKAPSESKAPVRRRARSKQK
jgi:hypothetical protein